MVWNWIENNVYSLKKCFLSTFLEIWLLFDQFEFCVTLLKLCPHTWFWGNKVKLWHHPDFFHIALFRKQCLWNKGTHQPVIQFCSYLVTWDLHNSHTQHCRLFTKFAFIHQIMCFWIRWDSLCHCNNKEAVLQYDFHCIGGDCSVEFISTAPSVIHQK